jgi:hypothetical protein
MSWWESLPSAGEVSFYLEARFSSLASVAFTLLVSSDGGFFEGKGRDAQNSGLGTS